MDELRRRLAAEAERPLDKQSFVYRLLSAPAAGLYGALTLVRRAAYDHGFSTAHSLPGLTISVGNLVAGGTGKTPVVLEIARLLVARGAQPAILTRGYGAGLPPDARLELGAGVPVWSYKFSQLMVIPDEPALLSRSLPTVPVLVGADRKASAEAFLARRPAPTHWLLDDGFQHRRLARDLDIVLLDARTPFANGALLPRGTLREPRSSLRRASAVLFTRAGDGYPTPDARAAVARLCPGPAGEARFITTIPSSDLAGGPLDLAGGEVLLAAGIARPERLEAAVAQTLGRSVRTHFVPDHAAFAPEALLAAAKGVRAVLTTPKDYWRDPAVFAGLASPVGLLGLEVAGAGDFLQRLLGNPASRGR